MKIVYKTIKEQIDDAINASWPGAPIKKIILTSTEINTLRGLAHDHSLISGSKYKGIELEVVDPPEVDL